MDRTTLAQIRTKTFIRSEGFILMNRPTDRLTEDTYAVFISRSVCWWTAQNLHTKNTFSINYNVINFTTSFSVCGLVWAVFCSSLLEALSDFTAQCFFFFFWGAVHFKFQNFVRAKTLNRCWKEKKKVMSNISFLLRCLFCGSRHCKKVQNKPLSSQWHVIKPGIYCKYHAIYFGMVVIKRTLQRIQKLCSAL